MDLPEGRILRIWIVISVFFFLSGTAFAQAGPGKALAWDQSGATVADAQAYTYTVYADGATQGTVLAPVMCSAAAGPVVCSAAFPAFPPGDHTLQLTASSGGLESAKSAVFSFTFVVVPNAPSGLRVQ